MSRHGDGRLSVRRLLVGRPTGYIPKTKCFSVQTVKAAFEEGANANANRSVVEVERGIPGGFLCFCHNLHFQIDEHHHPL